MSCCKIRSVPPKERTMHRYSCTDRYLPALTAALQLLESKVGAHPTTTEAQAIANARLALTDLGQELQTAGESFQALVSPFGSIEYALSTAGRDAWREACDDRAEPSVESRAAGIRTVQQEIKLFFEGMCSTPALATACFEEAQRRMTQTEVLDRLLHCAQVDGFKHGECRSDATDDVMAELTALLKDLTEQRLGVSLASPDYDNN